MQPQLVTAHDPRFHLAPNAGSSACEICQGPHPTPDCPENKSVDPSGFFLDDGNHEPLSEEELREHGIPELLHA